MVPAFQELIPQGERGARERGQGRRRENKQEMIGKCHKPYKGTCSGALGTQEQSLAVCLGRFPGGGNIQQSRGRVRSEDKEREYLAVRQSE